MRLSLLLAVALALPACSGTETLSSAALADTTWSEVCPGSNPERTYLRLNADGTFGFNYDAPSNYETDGDETWSVEGGTLVISWNDGYASTRYDLSGVADGTLPGTSTKSCGDRAQLVRT